jgi:hypothetical protein
MFRFERTVLTAALFLLSTIIIGCGAKEGTAPPAAPAPASQPAAAAAPAPAPAAAPAAPSAPSAATEGDIPGIRVAINELKRTSSSVTLKFTLYNDSATTFKVYGTFDEDPYRGYRNFAGVHLIDTASKKKYFAVADSDRKCLCSDEVADMPSNSSVALWVKYPPVPDDVQKITVQIPHFIPFEDVPLTR